MADVELMLNGLAEASATAISKETGPEGFAENASVAVKGATIAKNARLELESELGHSVISSENALAQSPILSFDPVPETEGLPRWKSTRCSGTRCSVSNRNSL